MQRRRNLVLVSLVLSATGCGERRAASLVTVVDSGGIEIVTSSGPRWDEGTAWRLADGPALEIGVVEGSTELLFSNVEDVDLLDDGRIAVADRGSSQIRFFDRDGTYAGFIGGPGDGPGELGYITDIGRCGADSLYVFELDDLNVVFTATGEYIREARPYDDATLHRRPYSLVCSRTGHYAAIGWDRRLRERTSEPPPIGFYRSESHVWILTPSWRMPDPVIEEIPAAGLAVVAELGPFVSSERIGVERGSRPHPFGRATAVALSEDALYVGTSEEFEIRRHDLAGRLTRIVRWPGLDLTIGEEHLAAYRTAQLEAVDPSRRPALERSIAEMPAAERFPAYSGVRIDPAGHVWVEAFAIPGRQVRTWTVLDADGQLLGEIDVPVEFEITDIGRDAVVGVALDELGVERVRMYELLKPRS